MNGRTLEGPNKSARGTNNTIVGPYGVAFGDSNKVTIRVELVNIIKSIIVTPCSPPSPLLSQVFPPVVLAEIQTQDYPKSKNTGVSQLSP
jgi:hypothetical protein